MKTNINFSGIEVDPLTGFKKRPLMCVFQPQGSLLEDIKQKFFKKSQQHPTKPFKIVSSESNVKNGLQIIKSYRYRFLSFIKAHLKKMSSKK